MLFRLCQTCYFHQLHLLYLTAHRFLYLKHNEVCNKCYNRNPHKRLHLFYIAGYKGNNYDTNETTNPTSTKPKKDVFDSQNDQASIDGQIVKAGQELLYKVTYKNTTGKDQKVEIKDKIPEYTTYVDGSASEGGVYKDPEITWTKEKVAADETFEVTFKGKVKDDVSQGSYYKNRFKAIPATLKALPSPKVRMPLAETQMATVLSNCLDLPHGLSR